MSPYANLPSRSRAAVLVLTATAVTIGAATAAQASPLAAASADATAAPAAHRTHHRAGITDPGALGVLASDAFGRTVTGGFGTADAGGAWYTPAAPSAYAVSASAARTTLATKGSGADALLKSVSSTDTDLTAGLSLDRAQTGSGTYVSVIGRQAGGSGYRLKLHYFANRTVSATLVSTTASGDTALGAPLTLSGYAPGSVLRIRLDVAGTAPTTISGKVWPASGSEPTDWQLRATDSTAALQVPGAVGLSSYLSSTVTNAPMTVALTDLQATGATTAITGGPAAGSDSTDTTASFTFTGSRSGASFQCSLDAAAPAPCTSPTSYAGLAVGSHSFTVRGVDADGHLAAADSRAWTVDAPPPPPAPVEPGPTNTGVPAGTVLTQHYGDITLDQPGETLDATDVHGFVWIKAPNVTITRSIIRGGYGTYGVDQGLVTDYGYPGFVISDSELTPEHPSVSLDAIKGWDFTATRINAHGTVDGAKIHGDDVVVQDSWIHDLVTYAVDPYQNGGQSHNDGVQILGGNNITVRGSNISGGSNTALLITQDLRAATNVLIDGNWFDGGNQSIGLMAKPLPVLSGVTLTDNQFGHNTRYHDCAVLTFGTVVLTAANNVWEDTGLPIRIHAG